MESFGKRLRKVRKSKELTIEKLSELCESSESVIRNYEKSRCMPSCYMLIRLCNALQVEPSYLLEGELSLKDAKQVQERIDSLPPDKHKLICDILQTLEKESS